MTDGTNTQHAGMTPSTRRLFYQTSTDDGKTLSAYQQATVNIAPETMGSSTSQLYPDNPVLGPDGTLYLPTYAVTAGPGGAAMSALVLQSKDQGVSWTLNSVIARGSLAPGSRQFNETALAFTQKGDVLAVMRNCLQVKNEVTGAVSCTYVPLQVSRTANLEQPSWSAPTQIAAPGFPSMIRPRLAMLPNGVLTLQAGREDTWLVTSTDGSGDTWTNPTLVYRNGALDQNGQRVPYPGTINEGSSGNSGFAWVQSNRVLSAADTCHSLLLSGQYQDKCTWRSHLYTMSDTTTQGVVRKPIDILTPGAGKIDLLGKIVAKKASISVTNPYTNPARKRLGPNGAVDGSTETWSAAATAGGPGAYTVTLDREYSLNRIGLAQWIGRAQASTVQVATSAEGPWTTVWETGSTTDQAMRYKDITPVRASFVRVTSAGSDSCPAGMAAPCSMLAELELYGADLQTFENDPLYTFPRDYVSSSRGVRTNDTNTQGGGRVIELSDTSQQWGDAQISKAQDPSAGKVLEFSFKPHWYGFDDDIAGDKFLITLTGTSGKKSVDAYRLAIADDGSLHAVGKKGWTQVAPAGTVPGTRNDNDAWSRIRIEAGPNEAAILVNGTRVAVVPVSSKVQDLTGHTFACDTDPRVDDQIFYLDDILFTAA